MTSLVFTRKFKKRGHRQGQAYFPLGEFVRANREKSNLIGWRQTLTTSPPNHIRFLLVHAKEITKWKTGFRQYLPREHFFFSTNN